MAGKKKKTARIYEYDAVAKSRGITPRDIETDMVAFEVGHKTFYVKVNQWGELEVRLVSEGNDSCIAVRVDVSNLVRLAATRLERPIKHDD